MNTVSELTTIVYTGDIRVDSLLDSVSPWNFLLPYRNTLYYTFDSSDGSYIDSRSSSAVSSFNTTQQSAARGILDYVSGLTGIGFVEVANSSDADLHFGNTDLAGGSVAGLAGISKSYTFSADNIISLTADATIWLDDAEFGGANSTPTAGSSGYQTLLHEIGHALGLGHPFNSPNALPADLDNTRNTVMSYEESGAPKSTFQAFDIWALTWIYGQDGLGGGWGYNSANGFSLDPGSEDVVSPTITGFSPADGSIGVALDAQLEISFSEPIVLGTGLIRLKTAAGAVVESFDVETSGALQVSGNKLIIVPSSMLTAGEEYRLEIASGSVVDLAGNHFAGSTAYNFFTESPPDTAPPVVVSYTPADGSDEVSIGTTIELKFNEDVDPGVGVILLKSAAGATVTSWNIESSPRVTLAGDKLTLNISDDLSFDTRYILTIPQGAITDLEGNPYGGGSTYDFTTEAPPDLTPPEISGYSPGDGTMGVGLEPDLVLVFDEVVVAGEGIIQLRTDGGLGVESWSVPGDSDFSVSGNRVTLSVSGSLSYDTRYVLYLPSGYVVDLAGNPAADSSEYDFLTLSAPDITAPVLSEMYPLDDSTGVEVGTSIELLFSENIIAGDGSIVLRKADGQVVEIFDMDVSERVQIVGAGIVIDPTTELEYEAHYVLEIGAGAVRDLSGNPNGEIVDYDFITEIANSPPVGSLLLYGDAVVGDELLVVAGAISDVDGLGEFSYQWYRNGVPIADAFGALFQLTAEDNGQLIGAALSYVDGLGKEEVVWGESRLVTELTSPSYTDLIEMYVIILGRAPAESGLDFWSSIINEGKPFEYVAGEMWRSAGAREFYPDDMSTAEVVTSVYENILAREPKEAGLNYWVGQWEENGPVDTMLEMIGALTANNSSDPLAIADKELFQSKVDIGGYLANTVGNTDVDLASAAFDYLESGYSVEETKTFIDTEMGVIGQAQTQGSEDLFA